MKNVLVFLQEELKAPQFVVRTEVLRNLTLGFDEGALNFNLVGLGFNNTQ